MSQTSHKNYVQYLRKNDYWQQVRAACFKRAKGLCEICGKDMCYTDEFWDCHHDNYKFLGRELVSEQALASCRILCRTCHEKLHGRKFDRPY